MPVPVLHASTRDLLHASARGRGNTRHRARALGDTCHWSAGANFHCGLNVQVNACAKAWVPIWIISWISVWITSIVSSWIISWIPVWIAAQVTDWIFAWPTDQDSCVQGLVETCGPGAAKCIIVGGAFGGGVLSDFSHAGVPAYGVLLCVWSSGTQACSFKGLHRHTHRRTHRSAPEVNPLTSRSALCHRYPETPAVSHW